MSTRRILALLWSIGALVIMLWSWATYAGPFRWAAEWELARFGYYHEKYALLVPLIIMMIPAAILGGRGPLIAPPTSPEARAAVAARTLRVVTMLGAIALLASAVSFGLGYWRMQTPPTSAALSLATGTEPVPGADLVTLTGIARTDLIVVYEERLAGQTSQWSYVPLVAPVWRTGDPIRFILRTNQTAWLPPEGSPGPWTPRMLRRGAPPFSMVTQPSVMKRFALPGVVAAEYEKARTPLDPAVIVVEPSAGEVYASYWIVAGVCGIGGVCALLAGLIGAINARRLAKAG